MVTMFNIVSLISMVVVLALAAGFACCGVVAAVREKRIMRLFATGAGGLLIAAGALCTTPAEELPWFAYNADYDWFTNACVNAGVLGGCMALAVMLIGVAEGIVNLVRRGIRLDEIAIIAVIVTSLVFGTVQAAKADPIVDDVARVVDETIGNMPVSRQIILVKSTGMWLEFVGKGITPAPICGGFWQSFFRQFGVQLQIAAMDRGGEISKNPAVAAAQGFLVGL